MIDKKWRDAVLPQDATLSTALRSLNATALQIVLVLDGEGRLKGTLTDGDVRRALLRGSSLDSPIAEHMNAHPISVSVGTDAPTVLDLLRRMVIKSVPVVNSSGYVVDLVSLHDLMSPPQRHTPAVIMAGGRGSRLRPITDQIPKPLVRVAGETLIDIVTRRLVSHGFREIWVTVHYRANAVEEHLGDGSHLGANVRYITEPKPLGTAGSVRKIPVGSDDTPILVCNADNIHAMDFGAMVDHHESIGAWATLAVAQHVTEVPYGVVTVDEGLIMNIVEKPRRTDWVAAGVSVLSRRALSFFPAERRLDIPEVIGELLARGLPTAAFENTGYWLDVGNREALHRANVDHGGRIRLS